jgi:hypothetical protein
MWNEGNDVSSFVFMSSLTHFLNPGHFPLKALLLVLTVLVVSSEVTSVPTLPAYGSCHLQLTADPKGAGPAVELLLWCSSAVCLVCLVLFPWICSEQPLCYSLIFAFQLFLKGCQFILTDFKLILAGSNLLYLFIYFFFGWHICHFWVILTASRLPSVQDPPSVQLLTPAVAFIMFWSMYLQFVLSHLRSWCWLA